MTDGITVTPAEIEQEFRRRNEKVKLDYVVIKPDDLQAKIKPSDADLAAYFEKNKARYTVPERRIVRYALLDPRPASRCMRILRRRDPQLLQQHHRHYKLPDRAHVAHILFKTVGKTDAEVEEIRKKAEDVLKKAKSGANFADLAKQYSEDTTKDKGGDLDWIVRGQTVPEFEQAAFSLPKGSISDLVKTQYGFHIIKVIDRQNARTQTLDEVRPGYLAALQQEKATAKPTTSPTRSPPKFAARGACRSTTWPRSSTDARRDAAARGGSAAFPEIGNSPEIADTIFRLRPGDDSAPIRTDKGYVVLSVKNIAAGAPGNAGRGPRQGARRLPAR